VRQVNSSARYFATSRRTARSKGSRRSPSSRTCSLTVRWCSRIATGASSWRPSTEWVGSRRARQAGRWVSFCGCPRVVAVGRPARSSSSEGLAGTGLGAGRVSAPKTGGSTGTPITRGFPAVLAFGSTWFGSEGGGWRSAHDKTGSICQIPTRIRDAHRKLTDPRWGSPRSLRRRPQGSDVAGGPGAGQGIWVVAGGGSSPWAPPPRFLRRDREVPSPPGCGRGSSLVASIDK
jgi:hypothetical protein